MTLGDVLEVEIRLLVYGGDGMGRLPDGRAVFVPYTLPGERVRLRVRSEKRGHIRGDLLEILQAAPERVAPPCPHFQLCGGCHYQHIDYAEQTRLKGEILREQLERLGGLKQVPLRPTVASPQPWQYRNHIQFHLSPTGKLGFQAAGSNQVVEISQCLLPQAELAELWPQIELEPLPGLERIGLRAGAGDEAQLILESADGETPELSVEELPVSVVHLGPGGALVLAGSEQLVIEVLGRPFQVSAASFFQVNTRQAEAMVTHLLEYLPLTPQTTLLDVYCGVGLFSAFLAGRVGRLVGIESSPSACEDFAANLDEFDQVELYAAPAEDVLPEVNFQPDIIVIDPPRAGIAPLALDGLLAQGAALIAYISCDPATLGRDARKLAAAGYSLEQITPFDLFPQTYHIESVSFWRKHPR